MTHDSVQNPFSTTEGAARYRSGRLFHHPGALDRVFEMIGQNEVRTALDVACGTGLSTIALTDRAVLVVGVDSVAAMVHLVKPEDNTLFTLANAEAIPFSSSHIRSTHGFVCNPLVRSASVLRRGRSGSGARRLGGDLRPFLHGLE